MRRLLLINLIVFLLPLWCSTGFADAGHALLIGVSDYSDTGLPSLEGPPNDLSLVRGVLLERFGFKDDHITVLLNEQASHTGVERAFALLAARIRHGDVVYIHFSGHGSYTPDLNQDEVRTGMDQTWVSYGSRRASTPPGEKSIGGSSDPPDVSNARLDDFDILDDEINQWLGPIFAKADCLVLVSDSCHSGTITRGDSPMGRAAPMDFRPHPAGRRKYEDAWHDSGVRIGAAGDNESAAEFSAEDGRVYGFFTWHWARALRRARPGETWEDVFKRTSARIALSKGCSQHPRIEGKEMHDRPIFGGSFENVSKTVAVKRVRGRGKRVVLGVGALLGATIGSIYRSYDPAAMDPGALPTAEIIRVYPLESVARVIRGPLKVGDLLVEKTHVYTIDPIKMFVNADFPETVDKPLLKFIKETLADLDAFETIGEQARADLVLYALRPGMKNGKFIARPQKNGVKHSLPESFRREPPQAWVLTPEEKPLYENVRINLDDPVEGGRLLRENLERIARIRALKGLESPPGEEQPVDFTVTVLTPTEACGRAPECISIKIGDYITKGPLPPIELEGRILAPDTVITFTIRNMSALDYYCYLLDLCPDGEINVIFGANENEALIPAGKEIDLLKSKVGLRITGVSGEETIKLIAARVPIDIGLATQDKFRKAARIPRDGVETLLYNAARGGAAGERQSMGGMRWSTEQFSFEVRELAE